MELPGYKDSPTPDGQSLHIEETTALAKTSQRGELSIVKSAEYHVLVSCLVARIFT